MLTLPMWQRSWVSICSMVRAGKLSTAVKKNHLRLSAMTIAPNWDTIIVGGGSAGAIVAGILAQRDPSEKILLVEAGRSDRHPLVQTPLGLVRMMGDRGFDWCFESVSSASQGQAITKIPRGKMGGSGSINRMLYIRGRPSDYDEWAEAHGAAGWAWQDVLPVFKRMEQNRHQSDDTRHGCDGPMHVEDQAIRIL